MKKAENTILYNHPLKGANWNLNFFLKLEPAYRDYVWGGDRLRPGHTPLLKPGWYGKMTSSNLARWQGKR